MMIQGLGCAASTVGSGFISSDCTSTIAWALDPRCWKYAPSAWNQMCQFTVPPSPVPPPAVGAGTSTTPAPYDCAATPLASPSCPGYDAAVSAALAAGETATQIQNQEWANQQPIVMPNCGSDTPVQDSAGNWTCPSSMSWSTIALIAAGIIGAGIFFSGRRR
jgi:hypothetical protein